MATIYITPRQAELLSYLTGRGPVGEWVSVPRREVMADLGMSSSAIAHKLAALICMGLVQRDWHLYRVIRRLEDGLTIMDQPTRPKTKPKPKASQPKKIRYSGFDPYQAAQFR